jgi:RimJ/RimL family protein N-acetyltransferase
MGHSNENLKVLQVPSHKLNIRTRSITFKDVEFIYNLLSYDVIAKYNNYPYPPRRQDVLNYIQSDLELKFSGRGERLVILNEEEPIGTLGYRNYYKGIELSFELLPKFQGLGIMYNVLLEHLPQIVAKYKPTRFIARVHNENKASLKLLGRLGFVEYKRKLNQLFFEFPITTG